MLTLVIFRSDEPVNALLVLTEDVEVAHACGDRILVLRATPDDFSDRADWWLAIVDVDQDEAEFFLLCRGFDRQPDAAGTDIDLGFRLKPSNMSGASGA